MPEFNPTGLASTVWAVATLAWEDRPLIAAISASVEMRLEHFGAQNLANTAWAFAVVTMSDAPVVAGLARGSQRAAEEGRLLLRDVANLAWAFARLLFFDGPLLATLAGAAAERPSEFGGQELSSILWAFASFAVLHESLMAALSPAVSQRCSGSVAQSLMMTAWSFATLAVADWAVLRAVALAACQQLSEFNELLLSSLLWSLASCPVDASDATARDALLVSLARAPVVSAGHWRGHALCLLANALYQVRDCLDAGVWQRIVSRWEEELDALAKLLMTMPFPVDEERYVRSLVDSDCFHAGPFFTDHLLSRLGVQKADEAFALCSRRRLAQGGEIPGRGIRCVAAFRVSLPSGGGLSGEAVFGPAPAGAGSRGLLVPAPLAHDRSGHAEFQAMSWLLRQLEEAEVSLDSEVEGDFSMHVTHHPCLSCMGALAQLRKALPKLRLAVS